jgi:hypothetical protein
MKGAPLPGATIVLVPTSEGAESATGLSDDSGKFSLSTYVAGDGARPGDYRVKVMKYDSPAANPGGKNLTYEEEQNAPDTEVEARPVAPPRSLIPKKYESETTSGITHKVGTAPSTLEIKIE